MNNPTLENQYSTLKPFWYTNGPTQLLLILRGQFSPKKCVAKCRQILQFCRVNLFQFLSPSSCHICIKSCLNFLEILICVKYSVSFAKFASIFFRLTLAFPRKPHRSFGNFTIFFILYIPGCHIHPNEIICFPRKLS